MKKSVILVEPDRALREHLAKILAAASNFKCAEAFISAEAALPEILELEPDVVLLDFRLPGMAGSRCAAEIKKRLPATEIIVLLAQEDQERILQALKAGASGYLIKARAPEQLLEALQDACDGGAPISSRISRKLVEQYRLLPEAGETLESLSPREREVLELLSSGLIYKEIGERLGIGVETVRTHVKSICQKMGVRNRLEAIARRRAGS